MGDEAHCRRHPIRVGDRVLHADGRSTGSCLALGLVVASVPAARVKWESGQHPEEIQLAYLQKWGAEKPV